jgi:transposase
VADDAERPAPWHVVYDQTRRWLKAGVFEAMVHDLRALLRLAERRDAQPSAAILDSQTLQSSPDSGPRAGYDRAKRKRGSKVHTAPGQESFCVVPSSLGDRGKLCLGDPLSTAGARL